MTTRVAVVGAGGRMGRTMTAAIAEADGLDLAAAVSRRLDGHDVNGVVAVGSVQSLVDAGVDVLLDFTLAAAGRETLMWAAAHSVHAVVGTTGFDDADLDAFRAAFTSSNCLIAPNFAISAVLMMRLAELAAPHFETVEIVELHHDGKADAPSGTAMMTALRIAAVAPDRAPDHTRNEVVPGARGGAGPGGIHIHSVRLRGLQAHQEVIFGTAGQSLTLRQDSYDSSSYVPGVLLACRRIAQMPGLTVGLEAYLGF